MNIDRVLVNLGIIRRFEIPVDMQPEEFAAKLRKITRMQDPYSRSGRLNDVFSGFDFHRYVGFIHDNHFRIRQRKPFVVRAIAFGAFRMEGDKLKIQTEVSSLTTIWKIYFILAAIMVVSTVVNLWFEGGYRFLFIPIFVLRAGFFVGLPTLLLNYASKSLASSLQMEFRYLKNRA